MADHTVDLGVDQLLRGGGALPRIGRVVFRHEFELDFLFADDDVPGIEFFDRQACAVFRILADMRDRPGGGRNVADLHDLLLRMCMAEAKRGNERRRRRLSIELHDCSCVDEERQCYSTDALRRTNHFKGKHAVLA